MVNGAAVQQDDPRVSIVMPLYNGRQTLARAASSVINQTMSDWELLIVDDFSSDGSYEAALQWAKKDRRVRVFRNGTNLGESAARNLALQQARGDYISYLDCDDEYYPNYLESVTPVLCRTDVAVCGYDICIEAGSATEPVGTWDPACRRASLFAENISTPLGVTHRRKLLDIVGGFNELLWFRGAADFWRRLARSGAEFTFLPVKAGRFIRRAGSQSRSPHIAKAVARGMIGNRAAGSPLYHAAGRKYKQTHIQKIAFVSPSAVFDFSSGAAVATLRQLSFLQLSVSPAKRSVDRCSI